MIERYALRYFLAVVDTGNFSRAAERCSVTQPTLSVGIAKLERDLGQPLFHRSNRRVELTPAGARFARHARRIEAEFERAMDAARESGRRETLRLGVLLTTPAEWIERLIDGGNGAALEIVEGRERDLAERLTRGRLDAALSIVRPESDRFAADPLFEEGYSLALPRNHPLADRPEIPGEELADNVFLVRRNCEALSETSRYFTARGVRPFFAARTHSDERALAYVRAGLGVTVMPDCFHDEGIARPSLTDFAARRTIGLLYAPHANAAELREEPALRRLTAMLTAPR